MPSTSKAQHGFMGLVRGVKEGTTPLASVKNPKKVKAAAESMSREQLRDFTKTREAGLPRYAKGSQPSARLRQAKG